MLTLGLVVLAGFHWAYGWASAKPWLWLSRWPVMARLGYGIEPRLQVWMTLDLRCCLAWPGLALISSGCTSPTVAVP